MNTLNNISVLTDIKKSLSGISEEDPAFDQDILLQINSAIAVLHQLGIGPKSGLIIQDKSTTWNDIVEDPIIQGLTRQFVLCSVKIAFDPPTSSFVLSALQEQRKELSFRLTVEHDRLAGDSNGI